MGYYIDFLFANAKNPDNTRLAELFLETGVNYHRLKRWLENRYLKGTLPV